MLFLVIFGRFKLICGNSYVIFALIGHFEVTDFQYFIFNRFAQFIVQIRRCHLWRSESDNFYDLSQQCHGWRTYHFSSSWDLCQARAWQSPFLVQYSLWWLNWFQDLSPRLPSFVWQQMDCKQMDQDFGSVQIVSLHHWWTETLFHCQAIKSWQRLGKELAETCLD